MPVAAVVQAQPQVVTEVHNIVQHVTQQVPFTPQGVKGLLGLALTLLISVGAGLFHSVIKRDGWSRKLNTYLAYGYSGVVAVLALYLQNALSLQVLAFDWHKLLSAQDVTAFVATGLLVYGATQARYNQLFVSAQHEGLVGQGSTTVAPASDLPVADPSNL